MLFWLRFRSSTTSQTASQMAAQPRSPTVFFCKLRRRMERQCCNTINDRLTQNTGQNLETSSALDSFMVLHSAGLQGQSRERLGVLKAGHSENAGVRPHSQSGAKCPAL